MSLFDRLRKPKDVLVATVIKPILQSKLEPYGTMTTPSITSADKSIHLSLDLKVESSPIEIDCRDYDIVKDAGESAHRFGAIETSRARINQFIQSYLPEERKTIGLPPAAANVLL
jgi:hypothetical protein